MRCPACDSPGYAALFGFPTPENMLLGCDACGNVATSTGRAPTDDEIRSFLSQIDQGRFLEAVRTAERDMATRTGDRAHARAFFADLFAWFERGLASDFASLVLSDRREAAAAGETPAELDPDAWSTFRTLMVRYPAYRAPATIKAYGRDFGEFRDWCFEEGELALPASADSVASYVRARGCKVKPSTVKRELAAIAFVHRIAQVYDPTSHIEVRMAAGDLERTKGNRTRPRAAVRHQAVDEGRAVTIDKLLEACDNSLTGVRNKALLSLHLDAGLRASELLRIQAGDFKRDRVPGGGSAMFVFIEKSKTDQRRLGSERLLSAATWKHIQAWKAASKISAGFLFRPIIGGKVNLARNHPLKVRSYRDTVKAIARAAQLPVKLQEQLSTHSFRIGAAEELRAAGGSGDDVMKAFDMKDPRTAARYAQHLPLIETPQLQVVEKRRLPD